MVKISSVKALKGFALSIYQIHRERALLGQGAFGQVYKGVWQYRAIESEERVDKEVAVKTMKDATSEEEVIKFLQEAAIMGQFDHPNIVKIMGVMAAENNVGNIVLASFS